MNSTVRVNEVGNCANLKSKGCIFKCLLHGASAEKSQVAAFCRAGALGVLKCDSVPVFHGLDLLLEFDDVVDGLLLGSSDWFFAETVVRVAGADMLL